MDKAELQAAIGAAADGVWGPKSKAALLGYLRNVSAPLIGPADLSGAATAIGCSILQIRAIWRVESGGRGFDSAGRPKILFERHKFHRFTGGRFSPAPFSQSAAGGYSRDADGNGVLDAWDRLSDAIATGEVDAAFMAASWGAFQIMGEWWDELGYASPFAMACACVPGEAGHLDMLVRFIRQFELEDEAKAITSNPDNCRRFAAAYNGKDYARGDYHRKLAKEMSA